MSQTILYTSRATLREGENPNARPFWLDRLVEHAGAKNKARDISGVLSYKEGKIIQLIEGEPAQLQNLFAKISNDSRHHDLRILLNIKDSKRIFSDWNMVLEANIETSLLFREFLYSHFENLVDMNDIQRDELVFFIDNVFHEILEERTLH
jgi:hypothetical protein